MSKCVIGYGLLPDENGFTAIRSLELDILRHIGEHGGLYQPPHVTIKRPFTIDILERHIFIAALKSLASSTKSITISFNGSSWFGQDTLYLPTVSRQVRNVHEQLLDVLAPIGVNPTEFDGDGFIPHVTLAMSLSEDQARTVKPKLQEIIYNDKIIKFTKIGLFLRVDNSHWIVVAEEKMSD